MSNVIPNYAEEDGVKQRDMPISDFIKLLCDRMDNNPHEFYRFSGAIIPEGKKIINPKWREYENLMESVKGSWNARERKEVAIRLRNIRMQEAHERLMAMLLAAK